MVTKNVIFVSTPICLYAMATPVPQPVQAYLSKEKRFLINDLAAATGLSLFEAERGVEALMERYECRLQVTPEGNIVYNFGKRKGEKTPQERLAELSQKAYQVFTFLFKLCISAVLLIYFVVFIVVLIALIVAALASLSGGSDGDSDIDIDIGFGAFFGEMFSDIFQAIFIWDAMSGQTYYERDSRGYPYKRYRPKTSKFEEVRQKKRKKKGKPEPEKPQKRFVQSVYDYVFGEKRYQPDALANQREIASFVRQNNGILTIPDVMMLNGLPRSEAEKLFSDVLIRFEGSPAVSSEGVLYGDFKEFTRKEAPQTHQEKIIYYWNEYKPEYQLTGNPKERNRLITFLNGFNLFFAFLGLTEFFNVMLEEPDATWMIFWLGWVPLVFSLIFFLVPIIRSFRLRSLRQKRYAENLRKRMYKALWLTEGNTLSLAELRAAANQQRDTEEELTEAQVEAQMKTLQHEVEADTKVREQDAAFVFDLSKLREAQAVSQRLALGAGNA